MTSTERQREFRERHPGYYQRLHAKRKATRLEMAAQAEFVSSFVNRISGFPPQRALPAPVEAIVYTLTDRPSRVACPV